MPAYQQQWGAPTQGTDAPQQTTGVQMNPTTGQPDYSLQWAEYYRSMGMHREADLIEQVIVAKRNLKERLLYFNNFNSKVKTKHPARQLRRVQLPERQFQPLLRK